MNSWNVDTRLERIVKHLRGLRDGDLSVGKGERVELIKQYMREILDGVGVDTLILKPEPISPKSSVECTPDCCGGSAK